MFIYHPMKYKLKVEFAAHPSGFLEADLEDQ